MAAAFVALLPGAAVACPVCFSAADQRVLDAYYLSAAVMGSLPFLVIGAMGVWLHQRFRNDDESQRREEQA